MEEVSVPPAPAESSVRPRGLPFIIAAAGLLLVALVALLYVFYLPARTNLQLAWVALTLPAELEGVHALSTSDTGSILYRFDRFRFSRAETVAGRVVALVPSTPDPVVIRGDQGFSLASGDRIYYASSSAVAPAASPSGKLFLFSRVSQGGAFAPDPGMWEVILVHRESGDARALGGGTAGVFVDDTKVVRVMSAGVFLLDLTTGLSTALIETPFTTPVLRIEQSPSRALLAWIDPSLVATVVYRYTGAGLEEVATLPSMQSSALGNDALYEVKPLPDGTAEVWRYELTTGASATKLYTFPDTLKITELYL